MVNSDTELGQPLPATRPRAGRRAAKKERTRRLLIEAAANVIAERGFHEASLMEVASRAGLTTGAVYSNFRSKEDLLLAVIEEAALPLDLGSEDVPTWERLRLAATLAARGTGLPVTARVFKLQLEFALLAMSDPRLMQKAIEHLRADRAHLEGILASHGTAPQPEYRPPPDQLATVVIAALQGLIQHRFLDEEAVPEELLAWTTQALLHAASEGTRRQATRTAVHA